MELAELKKYTVMFVFTPATWLPTRRFRLHLALASCVLFSNNHGHGYFKACTIEMVS